MTISEFLAARLDEARQRAEAMEHFTVFEQPYYSCAGSRTEPYGDLEWGEEHCDCHLAERKARALREVEAKRAIIERYRRACGISESIVSFISGQDDGYRQACLDAISDLAAIDSDHPDYDESWRP